MAGCAIAGWRGGTSKQRTETYGRMVRAAVRALVRKMIAETGSLPWSGRIAAITEQGVFVNGGRDVNMAAGDRFQVIRRGKAINDPATGQLLGYEERLLGTVEVVSVQDKLSVAKSTGGSGFEVGDVLRLAAADGRP